MHTNHQSETSHNPQLSDSLPLNTLSMVTARNKLRQTQDKIYLAKHRLSVIRTLNSRIQRKKVEEERQKMKSLEISQLIKREKDKKDELKQMRYTEREKIHQKNQNKRNQHKNLIQSFRTTFKDTNKWIYEQTKKQRERNEELIKKKKDEELVKRQKKREELFQNQKKRLQSIQQFMKSKRQNNIEKKDSETKSIKNQIDSREKVLIALERKGSEASQQLNQKSQPKLNNQRVSKVEKTYRSKFFKKSKNEEESK